MACLRHPIFVSGEATTTFIDRHGRELRTSGRTLGVPHVALAALLLNLTDPHAPPWRSGRTLAATFPQPVRLEIDHRLHELEVLRERDGAIVIDLGGEVTRFEVDQLDADTIRFSCNGVLESARFLRDRDHVYFMYRGLPLAACNLTFAAPANAAAVAGDGTVRAAMNGRVVAMLVKPGERVEAGQPVMILEAMKMEHVHVAPTSGTISAIGVAEGEQVTTGQVVVAIEARS
jgi:geranyl-CoA carboxylase alpha subunit